jgi:glutathione S-transferase
MKLYHAVGTCSLSPLIVAREAGIAMDVEKVDITKTPHRTETGADFTRINPKGYVPVLRLDDGGLLSEGAAIVQFLADLAPESGLAPPWGSAERYRLQEWLSFIGTELHKMFSPWLFHPEVGATAHEVAREKIRGRFAFLDGHLDGSRFLLGTQFTAADAYCFAIVSWSKFAGIDIAHFRYLASYMDRITQRPAVREAMRADGMPVLA